MKLLVTGASGLLGTQVVQTARDAGVKVVAVGWENVHLIPKQQGVEIMRCDVTDFDSVDAIVRDTRPDVVMHCAAMTGVDMCERERERAFAVNVIGTRHVRDACKATDSRLIYISTPSVFPGDTGDYKEDDAPSPSNYYSLTKLLGEEAALAYGNGMVIRANIIGAQAQKTRFLNLIGWLVEQFGKDADLSLVTDVRVNPISTISLAEILISLLDYRGAMSLFHVGSSDVVSKAQIGRMVARRFPGYKGRITEVEMQQLHLAAPRAKEMWISTSASARALGQTMPTVEAEIDRIMTGIAAAIPTGRASAS